MLHVVAIFSIAFGLFSSPGLAGIVYYHPERMSVMNRVWPLLALAGDPLLLWLYRRYHSYAPGKTPFCLTVSNATSHCGAGYALSDLLAEGLLLAAPGILVGLKLGSLQSNPIFAGWVVDFVLAYLLGMLFQYFTIALIRQLGLWDGIVAALKADTLSLVAWQIGMYSAMAIGQFGITRLATHTVEFWFAIVGCISTTKFDNAPSSLIGRR